MEIRQIYHYSFFSYIYYHKQSTVYRSTLVHSLCLAILYLAIVSFCRDIFYHSEVGQCKNTSFYSSNTVVTKWKFYCISIPERERRNYEVNLTICLFRFQSESWYFLLSIQNSTTVEVQNTEEIYPFPPGIHLWSPNA